ncbi:MAG TPA: hypothetical protein PKY82_16180 [Pyrinomonadaceae bacterium]|nr:hypothetical protein [Pyrinomonadaceae bacterium]
MSIFNIFKKKEKVDLEAKRLEYLGRFGRITEGRIIDTETTETGEIVFYSYSVEGADYESSEVILFEQMTNKIKYAPGAKIGVRYDPRRHANSILV